MVNSLIVITPYKDEGIWFFDDPSAGLQREPFVSGIPEMIDILTKDISKASQGFNLLFSKTPFPGYKAHLKWISEEYGGNWYLWEKQSMKGWLCPALLKYFSEVPDELYCKALPK